ncbi:hypothetical protein MGYG_05600 [Nannizzia gypsea CBS 118893]|uniref:DUF1203 domain-containing protein n=1 Tax=Arthroderma gypseum (strain ATCC MYA-4604 / CBS 118893) TaxID=535722 RepID=E4UWR0_ARTGP|nr:hypothetical protein MGYG_05600 [Nannizzia gypsea CBS 118893]EFR02603.1 hypothetical protein MGYG_05600 [Nannizzia gypsea CBS 118893]
MQIIPLPAPVEVNQPSTIRSTITPTFGCAPCRRCLKNAALDEDVLLISYNPFLPENRDTPYSGAGPIFLHANECPWFVDSDDSDLGIPPQFHNRSLTARAYDAGNMMVWSKVVEGAKLMETLEREVFDDLELEVEYVHVHYTGPGCFAFKVIEEDYLMLK